MNIQTIEYKKINECMHVYEHDSGLKAFVIPKKGYSKKYATFATHYGSINSKFQAPGDKDITHVPDGIAHFLEHKLFEQKDGSVMDKFSQLGSNPNAYTGFSQTVYLFSCTDRFDENFKLLLNFVQNPFLTDESVNKEKGIIGQEIKMYEDDAGWRSFFNLLGAMYKENPVRTDIAGTCESISHINKDILYKCHNTFYHPSNMVILVVGDVDHNQVFEEVDRLVVKKDKMPEIKRIFPDEIKIVNKDYIEQKLAVSTPIFQMGFKDNNLITKGIECLEHEIAVKILLSMIMGRSSKLYDKLYNGGLINSSFEYDFTIEENYAFSMFGGESVAPDKVKEIILSEIKDLYSNGLQKDKFERIKRSFYGRHVKQLNSVERISHSFISVYFKDVNVFDYFDIFDKITFEYINEVFNSHFNMDNMSLSVVNPV